MKTITLEKAFEILVDADGIVIDDGVILYPSLDKLTGCDENEFMYLSWDDEGLEYSIKFCEGDNREVKISGSSMFLYDTDADGDEDHTQISILKEINIEENV